MDKILIDLGVNLASSIVYDIVKGYFKSTSEPTIQGLRSVLAPRLNVSDADIKAQSIIDFMAKNGDILIERSRIYAKKSIRMTSSSNGSIALGDNSSSITDRTSIKVGKGSQIVARGGGSIHQDEDGNITFSA